MNYAVPKSIPEARRALRNRIRAAVKNYLKPVEKYSLCEWSDKHVYLSKESAAEAGRYNSDRTPYIKEILNTIGDKEHEKVVIMAAAQTGKSSAILNAIAFHISSDPCPILYMLPELTMAKAFSVGRIDPLVRDTPILRDKIKKPRTKDSSNSMLHKKFPGGHITLIGSNAPSGLRARPIRVLMADEVDSFAVSAGQEGDPVLLATQRCSNFYNRKLIFTSTPTVKDISRIEQEFNLSDQRYFHLPCPHCGEYQKLIWRNIKYLDNNADSVFYECDFCKKPINESSKMSMMRKGKWIAENPNSKVAGFHLNGLYSPWKNWNMIVQQWLDSKNNPSTLRVFINTVLSETFNDSGDRVEFSDLAKRLEKYNAEVPNGVGILVAGVDVQQDRIECATYGFGAKEEMWLINYEQIFRDPTQDNAWNELSAVLSRKYKTANGVEVGIRAIGLDTGYLTEHAYRFVKNHRGTAALFALKGSNQSGRTLLSKPYNTKMGGVKLFYAGVDTAKDIFFQRLKITEHGPGFFHLPEWVDREFIEQLTSEKAITKYIGGRPKRVYIRLRRNEALDMTVYALCALQGLGSNIYSKLGELAENLGNKKPEDVVKEPKPPEIKPEPQPESVINARRKRMLNRLDIQGSWNKGFNI